MSYSRWNLPNSREYLLNKEGYPISCSKCDRYLMQWENAYEHFNKHKLERQR